MPVLSQLRACTCSCTQLCQSLYLSLDSCSRVVWCVPVPTHSDQRFPCRPPAPTPPCSHHTPPLYWSSGQASQEQALAQAQAPPQVRPHPLGGLWLHTLLFPSPPSSSSRSLSFLLFSFTVPRFVSHKHPLPPRCLSFLKVASFDQYKARSYAVSLSFPLRL